ncbi:MoxR family ATPase [Bacillus carboniphilus]|uniref:MoxR family ATPase n=1 Tax=Bacillus carboniphilus TaxID=86663 RepID=A0ABY9JS44_9BACI|nr:MoxR family ATPase [Bacillus carboniphilus]WLR42232.1 MoxR family ATPase [Bacillus carboniphilus]
MQLEDMHPSLGKVIENIEKVMVGKRDVSVLSLVALLTNSHVLLEDVPGVGKTMMVRTLAKSVGIDFKRIQFTPDLLPSDVTGVSIYNPKTLQFEFRPGPIMGNVVLADEINRTSPKTQSALLEGMEEGSVTVEGEAVSLNKPFFVMATQNPVDFEGTYPLPEAQLDRFLFKLRMGYPSFNDEMEVLSKAQANKPIEEVEPVMLKEELLHLQQEIHQVYVDDSIKEYIVDMVNRTRKHPSVYLGASPRGAIALMKAAQAYAFLFNRDYVIPDDIQYLAPFALAHRIILKSEARFEGKSSEMLVKELIQKCPVPVQRTLNKI